MEDLIIIDVSCVLVVVVVRQFPGVVQDQNGTVKKASKSEIHPGGRRERTVATVMTKDENSPHYGSQSKGVEGIDDGSQGEVVVPEISHSQDQRSETYNISHYIVDRKGDGSLETMGWKLFLDLRKCGK